jgi:hypothetical protein
VRPRIPAEALAAIEEHNQLDLELYEYAKSLFTEQLAVSADRHQVGGALSR